MEFGELIIGETTKGWFYVRPASWSGIWDSSGKLKSGNVLLESDNQQACIEYAEKFYGDNQT